MPFINWDDIPANNLAPGIRIRAPYGENVMMSLLEMEEGSVIPRHHHPHEQAGILLEGRMELTIGDESRVVNEGEAYLIPPNVPHRALPVGGPAVALDIFSPVREDYVDLGNRYIPTEEGQED
ncbi:MAG: cupin domain-containing protein [Candidatus Latescibacteria bacterium]|jgi:quercetin dioxygenase-like cupin family protein|nr:cupin domain-containing protein [Candidatus Latescibacterota bacterium]